MHIETVERQKSYIQMMHKSPQKLSHFGWTDIVCKYGYVHVSGVGGGTGLGDRMPYWLAADDVRDAGGARYTHWASTGCKCQTAQISVFDVPAL